MIGNYHGENAVNISDIYGGHLERSAGSLFIPEYPCKHKHYVSFSMARITPTRFKTSAHNKMWFISTIPTFNSPFEDISFGDSYCDDMSYSGGLFFSYLYNSFYKIYLGGTIGYEKNECTIVPFHSANDSILGTYTARDYIIAAEAKFYYSIKKSFRSYSGIGIGITTRSHGFEQKSGENLYKTEAVPTFHLNFMGLRFGDRIAFFVEFGIGYKGIINAGLSVGL